MTDAELHKFLSLKEQIAALEKEMEPLKKAIEAAGSMETKMFTVEIKQVEQNRACGCEELLEKVGFVKVNELGLIKTSTYNKVIVKQKLAKAV